MPARGAPGPARDTLLDRCVEFLRAGGFSQLSLREIAAGTGTSHRMLIYHFGSREGLLADVVGRVEAEQRAALAALAAGAGDGIGPAPGRADAADGADGAHGDGSGLAAVGPVAADGESMGTGRLDAQPEVGRLFWQRVADPALAPAERLFFEIYAQALYGRPWTDSFRRSVIADWVGPVEQLLIGLGFTAAEARPRARLALAATRGLLLDLLITDDRQLLDEAADLFAHLITQRPP